MSDNIIDGLKSGSELDEKAKICRCWGPPSCCVRSCWANIECMLRPEVKRLRSEQKDESLPWGIFEGDHLAGAFPTEDIANAVLNQVEGWKARGFEVRERETSNE